jgi:hypothetical protein
LEKIRPRASRTEISKRAGKSLQKGRSVIK